MSNVTKVMPPTIQCSTFIALAIAAVKHTTYVTLRKSKTAVQAKVTVKPCKMSDEALLLASNKEQSWMP